jgi:hypothetical protein
MIKAALSRFFILKNFRHTCIIDIIP